MNNLVRVIKKIIKHHADGTTTSHRQAFFVKKAAPGDQYDYKTKTPVRNRLNTISGDIGASSDSVEDDKDDDIDKQYPADSGFRMGMSPLQIPWIEALDVDNPDATDPVPAELRKRFDPHNIAIKKHTPMIRSAPISSVPAGDVLLWGAVESELINRLRMGIITNISRSSGSASNFLAKIESNDGVVERAYVRFDQLTDDRIYAMYEDIYDLNRDNGALSRHAAAAYELAKATGFDDIVPPTVYRYDEHDGLEPILSISAIEDLAQTAGLSSDNLKSQLGKCAVLELWEEGSTTICQQPWFSKMNSDGGDELNSFYEHVPESNYLIRGAVFDFIAWTGNRTWMDVVFNEDEAHAVRLVRNDLTFPNPRALGAAALDYTGSYSDGPPPEMQYMPLLWSDLVSMFALRGYDNEAKLYEEIAIDCTKKLSGQRVVEMVRTLIDHGLSLLSIGGVLSRVAFLRYGSHVVMRDPLVIARYYASLVSDSDFDPGFDIDLNSIEESINTAINKASFTDFNWRLAMRGEDDGGQ